MKKRMIALLLIGILGISGCQGKHPSAVVPTDIPSKAESATPPPTTKQTPVPTSAPTATHTPMPTSTPAATQTPVPTSTPKPTNTPVPTGVMEAPFTMVTPVPQSEIAEIAGTMTVDTYPVVDGSTATLPLSEAVFMLATGESAEVAAKNVKHTKTTNSYYRLYDKEADLLIVYEPSETVVERMEKEPILIKPIGLDALVFMANTANQVDSLTIEQLIHIYSGKINNWAEVGGANQTMLAFQRPVGSGSQSLMQKLVMGDVEMTTGDNVFRYNTMSDILEGMLSYNGEDNTLGYSVFYYANNMYFEKDLKFMGVNGVLPSTQTIYDGSYPCVNAFYAAIRVDEPEDSNARKLFDWLTGAAGQQLVLDLGYVPVNMPEGADISDVKTEQRIKREVLATEPLEEGQYFVMVNPQNTTSDYYYGDMTVYNATWEEIANFYNVTLNEGVAGIHTTPYLPVGQIRQNTEGKQEVRYGIYDLSLGEYSIKPTYKDLQVLDAMRGYYAVPQTDEDWMKYQVIDGTGEILLPHVSYEDWLTISPRGNGYLEMSYDYENWENGCTYRFYDENLKLVNVFFEKETAFPNDEDQIEGVGYYLLEGHGCLLDENGNVLISEELFLKRYGDGVHTYCVLPFYMPTLEEGEEVFGVWYKDAIYVVDRYLELLGMVYDVPEEEVQGAEFYEDIYSYWDMAEGDTVYRRYDGSQIALLNGRPAQEVITNWETEDYLIYARDGKMLYLEEHRAGGEILSYTVDLRDTDSILMIGYDRDFYVRISEDSGQTALNWYSMDGGELPLYHMGLYYDGKLLCETLAANEYVHAMNEGTKIWVTGTGEVEHVESESIFEELQEDYSYTLYDFIFVQGVEVKERIDRARALFYMGDAMILAQGNYVYAVSKEGKVLVRELQNLMSTD